MAIPRIVIVGGGIAGLSAAWACHRRGLSCVLLEAADRAGGVVSTERTDGLVLDAGPDAFLAQKPGIMRLCQELGIERELITMSRPRGAHVLAGRRFHALPEGGAFGLPLTWQAAVRTGLLSWKAKARLQVEPVLPKRAWPVAYDESAGAFIARRLGPEVARRIAQPLLGGIHAGDLRTLSARAVIPAFVAMEAAGSSVLRALRRQRRRTSDDGAFRSFREGMARLPGALVAALPPGTVRTGTTVTRVTSGAHEPSTTSGLSVTTAGEARFPADLLLLTAPAWATASLLEDVAPSAASLCASVPYASTATVLLEYETRVIGRPLPGSGYVVADPGEGDPVMAVTLITQKWTGRAPAGTSLIRAFFGGAGREAVLAQSDKALVGLAHLHLQRTLGVTGEPALTRVYRWTRASPQHTVGHAARISALQQDLDGQPGLGVAGSGFRAIGLPDVASDARREMDRLIDVWQQR